MYAQMILPGMTSAISSPESADGATPCGSPDGRTTAPCGPAPAPASHFPPPENGAASTTPVTCGPLFSGTSNGVGLTLSLASRYRVRTDGPGTMLYALKWRPSATPAGRWIPRLQASALRTSGSGSGGAGWPTPTANNGNGPRPNPQERDFQNLQTAAQLAGWATPTANGGTGAGTQGREGGPNLQTQAHLAGWCTPTATDAARGKGTIRPWDTGIPLAQQASLADSGPNTNGDGAETANGGQLNPALSLWLMGYPEEWLSCAESAMQSCRNRRRRSSKQ